MTVLRVEDPPTELVRLAVPAERECVRIVRLTASAVATRLGFDVEEIEDLRIAVDELASLLVERGGSGPLDLEFHILPDELRITGRVPAAAESTDLTVDELTAQILSAVIDDYELHQADAHIWFECRTGKHWH